MSRSADEDCPMNEQTVGFVLHALEPAEEIQVLRHLPGCASCRAVVGDAEGVFTRMGASVEQVDPPPSLRTSLMARVAQTPQVQGRPRRPQPDPTASNGEAQTATATPTPDGRTNGTSTPSSGSSVDAASASDVEANSASGPSTGVAGTGAVSEASTAGSEADAVTGPPAARAETGSSSDADAPARAPSRRNRETPPSRPGPSGPSSSSGPPSRRSWSSRRGRLVAAAVALIGVLVIAGLAVRTGQLQDQRDAELAQSRSMSELLDQLGRPGTTYALLAEEGGPTLAAVVVAGGERQVFPLALPANATEANIYVLWGLGASGTPEPLGTFDVLQADPGLREVGTGAAADAFAQYAISLEPGRTAPTTPTNVVAVGAVEA